MSEVKERKQISKVALRLSQAQPSASSLTTRNPPEITMARRRRHHRPRLPRPHPANPICPSLYHPGLLQEMIERSRGAQSRPQRGQQNTTQNPVQDGTQNPAQNRAWNPTFTHGLLQNTGPGQVQAPNMDDPQNDVPIDPSQLAKDPQARLATPSASSYVTRDSPVELDAERIPQQPITPLLPF
ncbi:hypothetical protein CLAIMM_13164 isoform 2, partial [Cladophialophora immunda]